MHGLTLVKQLAVCRRVCVPDAGAVSRNVGIMGACKLQGSKDRWLLVLDNVDDARFVVMSRLPSKMRWST